jgi:hypothetical protein
MQISMMNICSNWDIMDLSTFRRFLIVAVSSNLTLTFTIQPYLMAGVSRMTRFTLAVQSESGVEVLPFFLSSVDDAKSLIDFFLNLFLINNANVRVLENADLKVA